MSTAGSGQEWGPTVRGGRPRRGWGRWVRRLLLLAVVVPLVVGLAAGAYAFVRLGREPVEGLAAAGTQFNVLVVGSDSRAGLSREERRELRTGSAGGNRADTLFVLSVRGGDAAMLAFPRDLYVTRCDGSQGRINAALGVGGPSCLVRTVADLSGIPVHGFMTVSFGGFRDIVDAVGGVQMCLDEPIADRDAGIDLPAGCQRLSGPDALGYVRVRKIDNDLERIERQQQFLGALADELVSPSTLLNPLRLFPTAGSTAEALTVDQRMGPIDLGRVALGIRGLTGGGAVSRTVPTQPTTIGGASVLQQIDTEAPALYAAFRDGTIFAEGGDGLARSDVRVVVLNGTSVSGLAGQTADRLEAAGYQVADVGNAPAREVTTVRYPPGQEPAARLVAGDVPSEVTLEETSEVTSVTLVLGTDATR